MKVIFFALCEHLLILEQCPKGKSSKSYFPCDTDKIIHETEEKNWKRISWWGKWCSTSKFETSQVPDKMVEWTQVVNVNLKTVNKIKLTCNLHLLGLYTFFLALTQPQNCFESV